MNRELVLSVLQAVVLLLFNDVELGACLSYQQIKEGTGLGSSYPLKNEQN